MKKNGSKKRKYPARKVVVSSSDEDAKNYGEFKKVQVHGESGTINYDKSVVARKTKKNDKKKNTTIPQEILLTNSKRERVDVNDRCTCSPASLTDSYEKGATFCACFRVNLWQMRTQSRGEDRYMMTLRALSRKYCKKN